MSDKVFNLTGACEMGDAPNVVGLLYAPDHVRPRPVAQVILNTGAANVTFYPAADALDDLATGLWLLAQQLRRAQTPVPA